MLVAIISFEATGLRPADEPVSIGLLLLEVAPRLGTLIREVDGYYGSREPTVPISEGATAIHGLTMEMVRGKNFDLSAIAAILSRAEVLIAHGADFNAAMLGLVLPGIDVMNWRCSLRQIDWSRHYDLSNYKFETICEHLKISRNRPQIALDDCLALAKVLLNLVGPTNRSSSFLGQLLAQQCFVPRVARPVILPDEPTPLSSTEEQFAPWVPKPRETASSGKGLIAAAVLAAAMAAIFAWLRQPIW